MMTDSEEGGGRSNATFNIRPCTADDCDELLRMIKELASFYHMESKLKITAAQLKEDGFGPKVGYRCLVAEPTDHRNLTEEAPLGGFVLFYDRYSAWVGRCLFLEDLYVSPGYRKQGVGKALFKKLAQIAQDEGCARIDFSVMTWNENALNFYKRLDCFDMTEKQDWNFYRMDSDGIKKMAGS